MTPTVEHAERSDAARRLTTVLRWVAAGVYLVLLVAIVAVGMRQDAYARLQEGLTTGTVTEVTVHGAMEGPDGLSPGMSGTSTVRLEWQQDGLRRVAEVRQATPDAAGSVPSDGQDTVVGAIGAELRSLSPGVRVEYRDHLGARSFLGGWDLPGWAVPLTLGLIVTFIGAVSTDPSPRYGTAWAWVWLALGPAVLLAVPAYLLLGTRGASPGRRRLTGGWAFLISIVLPPALL